MVGVYIYTLQTSLRKKGDVIRVDVFSKPCSHWRSGFKKIKLMFGPRFFPPSQKEGWKNLAELPCWSSFCTKGNLFFCSHFPFPPRTQMGPLGFYWKFGLVLEGLFSPKIEDMSKGLFFASPGAFWRSTLEQCGLARGDWGMDGFVEGPRSLLKKHWFFMGFLVLVTSKLT